MQQLLSGYARFRHHVAPHHADQFVELEHQQSPHTLFITCSDSRVMPEMITQAGPGEIFCYRNPGNLVASPEDTSSGGAAAIEYAVQALQVKDIVLCGHTDCGAMRAILDTGRLQNLPAMRAWLQYAGPMAHAFRGVMQDPAIWPAEERLRVLTELNVIAQLRSLSAHPAVARAMRRGSLRIHGWLYEIPTGEVHCLDPSTGSFRPLLEQASKQAVEAVAA